MNDFKPREPSISYHTATAAPHGRGFLKYHDCMNVILRQWGIFVLAVVACSLLATPAPMAATLVPEGKVIVLDPGHGGHDTGSGFASRMTEKDITLELALSLKKTLHGFCRTYLTREGDYWVDLQKRTILANHRRADVFVSLHSSGSADPTTRGIRVFYHDDGGKQPLVSNNSDELGEPADGLTPWDAVQTPHRSRSKLLARTLHERFVAQGLSSARDIFKAPLYVLKGADCPAVMIETSLVAPDGTQIHPLGEERFDTLIQAITDGLNAYFGKSGSCITDEDVIEEDIPAGRGAAW